VAADRQKLEGEALTTAREVMTTAFFLTGLRVSEEEGLRLFLGLPYVEESTTYQYVLRLGGIRHVREVLLDLGKLRFGKPAKATVAALEAITDPDRLKRLTRRLLRVDGWE